MPDVPINQKPYTNVDDVGNPFAIQSFIDMDKDDFMNNRFRPGLGGDTNDYFADLSTSEGIDGVFELMNYDFAAVFSNGSLYKVDEDGTATEITGVTLNKDAPVSFADFGTAGYFCNNSRILKWTYTSSTCAFISDTDAPTDATHVAFFDSYLLALRADSQIVEFSDVDAPDTWLGERFTAEQRPDNLVAMFARFGEVFLPGTETIENATDTGDATTPFQRIPGATTERGSISPYSFTQIDNSYFFLDFDRRVIRMAGRNPQVISNPFDNEFQELINIEDCIGFHFNPDGMTKYILHFPSDGKTYAYDYKLDYWAEYSYWNHTTGKRNSFLCKTGAFISKWNKYICGSKDEGKLYIASRDYTTDEGEDVIPELVTGRIDWGKINRKQSRKITFKVKRGNAAITQTNAKIYMNKRINGKKQWLSNEKIIDLGITGDTYSYKNFRNLGEYRDVQYRIRMQGASSIISKMVETIVEIP